MYANKPPIEMSTYCTYYLECRLEEAMQHIQNLYAKKLKDDGEKELLEKLVEGLPKILETYEFSCILDYQRFLQFIARHKILVDIFKNRKTPQTQEQKLDKIMERGLDPDAAAYTPPTGMTDPAFYENHIK